MKPTEDLVQEHKAIKVMLGIMKNIADNIGEKKGVDTGAIEKIVDFLRIFADKCHHGKEEDALFPAMVSAGMPQELLAKRFEIIEEEVIGEGIHEIYHQLLEHLKVKYDRS